jgi:hypothetical protein
MSWRVTDRGGPESPQKCVQEQEILVMKGMSGAKERMGGVVHTHTHTQA